MDDKQINIKIYGLHCKSCEIASEEAISSLPGVKEVRVDSALKSANIKYDAKEPDKKLIAEALEKIGYSLQQEPEKIKLKSLEYFASAAMALSIISLLYFLSPHGIEAGNESSELLTMLIVGLVAGISTCMAIVGGAVMAFASEYAKRHPRATKKQLFIPHLYFNIGRIGGFFILGGILGFMGSSLKISPQISSLINLAVSIIIILLGLQIIDIFPAFNNFSLTLPKPLAKLIIKQKRYRKKAGPLLAGAASFFLPCGFTQAVQIYAVSSGSFLSGGLAMAIFAIGTSPGLLALGSLTSLLGGKRKKIFLFTAGLMVIGLGLLGGLNAYRSFGQSGEKSSLSVTKEQEKTQILYMEQTANGYIPNYFQVEAGKNVKWVINSQTSYSCASAFIVPSLKINKQLQKGENIIEFYAAAPGKIKFSCSMGMYHGMIEIIPAGTDGNKKDTESATKKLPICNINGCQ